MSVRYHHTFLRPATSQLSPSDGFHHDSMIFAHFSPYLPRMESPPFSVTLMSSMTR